MPQKRGAKLVCAAETPGELVAMTDDILLTDSGKGERRNACSLEVSHRPDMSGYVEESVKAN